MKGRRFKSPTYGGRAMVAVALAGAFACDDPSPQACATIPPQTTHVGVKTLVHPCFEHPEMVELTLDAVSSNPGVATSEVLENRSVRIVGVSQGTAVITVTATDPDGLTGELAFEVLVPNRPPRLRERIPAFRLEVGEPAVELVLSEYYLDPEGQQLTYGATSSDTRAVSVAVWADTLFVIGVSAGSATVTVTATDPGGMSDTAHVEALALKRPGAPTLTSTLYTDERGSTDSIVLAWTPAADTGSSAITGYRLEWRHESHHDPGFWKVLGTTDPDVHRTPGLTFSFDVAGYNSFRVRAVNEVGPGDPSNVETVLVVILSTPDPPRFSARKTIHPQFEIPGYYLEWEPAPSDTFTVRRWVIEDAWGGGDWDVWQTPGRHLRGLGTYPDWRKGYWVRYRIAAVYVGHGQGLWSNVVRAALQGPDQPTNLAAAVDGDSAVVLTWTAPVEPETRPVTGYMIETSDNGGRNWRYLVRNTESTATTYRHGNLAGGSTHLYAVSAITKTGIGPSAKVASATTEMSINARLDPSTPVRLSFPQSKRKQ